MIYLAHYTEIIHINCFPDAWVAPITGLDFVFVTERCLIKKGGRGGAGRGRGINML